MKYWFIKDFEKRTGNPIWSQAKAFGYRRKNNKDQVFVQTLNGKKWIYATIVDVEDIWK